MKRLAATAAAAIALTLALGALTASAGADGVLESPAASKTTPIDMQFRACGDSGEIGYSWFDLKTFNTACRNARKAVDAFVFDGDKKPFGWSCKSKSVGYELLRGDCTRFHKETPQALVFRYGS